MKKTIKIIRPLKSQNKATKSVKTTTTKGTQTQPKKVAKTSCNKTVSKKQPTKIIKPQTKVVTVPQGKKSQARAGEFWSVNSKETIGHKGLITKRRKSGKIDVITTTHSPYTKGRKNAKLKENPQKTDKRTAYAVKKVHKLKVKQLGKKQPDMKIRNKTDKAIIRNIKNQDKRNSKK